MAGAAPEKRSLFDVSQAHAQSRQVGWLMLALFVPIMLFALVSALLDIGLRQQLRPGIADIIRTEACTGNQAGLTRAVVALTTPDGQPLEAVWPCWREVPPRGSQVRALYRAHPAHIEAAGTKLFSPKTFAGFLLAGVLLSVAALCFLSSRHQRRQLAVEPSRGEAADASPSKPAKPLDPINMFRSLGYVALAIGSFYLLAATYEASRTWHLLSHGEPQVAKVLSAWPSGGRGNTWKTTFALTGPDGNGTTALWDSETFIPPGATVAVLVDRQMQGQARPAEDNALWGFARRMAAAGGIYMLIGLHFVALASLVRWVMQK